MTCKYDIYPKDLIVNHLPLPLRYLFPPQGGNFMNFLPSLRRARRWLLKPGIVKI